MKKLIVCLWLFMLFGGVSIIFWYYQLKYNLPTPVPVAYRPVANGATINLKQPLHFDNNKPVLLHFFNANCPCSRFNISHVKLLIAKYGQQVNFAVVMMNEEQGTAAEVRQKYKLDVPVIVDPALAFKCGVYSTPQAAILTGQHRLYYRGNYNANRYCTNPKTEYARLALTGLLKQKPYLHFDAHATTAYGCSLPDHYN